MHIPDELIEYFGNEEVILFVGAGFSSNAGLPGWVDLLHPLSSSLDYSLPSINAQIATEHLLTLAQYYENKFGRNSLIRYLSNKLDTTTIYPSTNHYLLASLPAKYVFTTNYDNLLEQTYRDTGQHYLSIINHVDFAFTKQQEIKIIKLCGDLTHPESLVITKQDFNIFYETHRGVIDKLRNALETKTVLFIGYSLKDPFINQIWDSINLSFGKYQRFGYAVLFDASDLEIDDLRRRNITVINLQANEKGKSTILEEWLKSLIESVQELRGMPKIITGPKGEVIERLSRIERKIDTGFIEEHELVLQIADGLTKKQIQQDEANLLISEIHSWIKELDESGTPVSQDMKSKLNNLSEHSVGIYQYLQLALPILPGLLSYNVEIGSQHMSDIKEIWGLAMTRFKKAEKKK